MLIACPFPTLMSMLCFVMFRAWFACVVSDTASMASAATGHSGSGATTASQMQDFHSLPDEIAHGISDIQALQSSTPVGNYFIFFLLFMLNFLFVNYISGKNV